MSRSRARKNRFKYQTLRRLGCFKIFVMDYPSQNGSVYPSMNFGSMGFSKEFAHELQHPRGSFFSITSHVDEGLVAPVFEDAHKSIWSAGLKHAQRKTDAGELLYPTVEPQVNSAMEHNLDVMCAVMGIDKENLIINHPVGFAKSVKDSMEYAVKLGQPITEPQELSDTDFLSPWPTRMNFAGIWTNPVDASKLEGPGIEQVIAEDLVNKAKQQLIQNRRERILKAAEVIGEDIQVDHYLLQDNIKVFRQHSDILSMIDVQEDTPEWVLVMIAACRTPEFINSLKGNGFSTIQLVRYAFNDLSPTKITDTYYLFDTTYSEKIEAFIPRFIDSNSLTVDFKATEQTGEEVQKFTEQVLSWSRSKDR